MQEALRRTEGQQLKAENASPRFPVPFRPALPSSAGATLFPEAGDRAWGQDLLIAPDACFTSSEAMADAHLPGEQQMACISPYFPMSHGIPRVDDRRVVSGIVYVIRNGLQWMGAPVGYGPHKTLYNRFIRWSRMGVFERIFAALAGERPRPQRIMIDATHLKAHRTTASLPKKGLFPGVPAGQKGG